MTDSDIKACFATHVGATGGLLQGLRAVQARFGYISPDVIAIAADLFNQTKAEVRGVVSFYDDLRETPAGRRVVRICQAEACQAVGARALTKAVSAATGLAIGETAADGSQSIEGVFCLGLCACGPAVMIDDTLYGRMDSQRIEALLA
jgi:formate dehydrogenase subunit gamma